MASIAPGDIVVTPSGRRAEVVKIQADGNVMLRYVGIDIDDTVTLRPEIRLVPDGMWP